MARRIEVEIVGDASVAREGVQEISRVGEGLPGRHGEDRHAAAGRRSVASAAAAGFAAGAIGTAGLVGAAKAAFAEIGEAQKVTRPDQRRL